MPQSHNINILISFKSQTTIGRYNVPFSQSHLTIRKLRPIMIACHFHLFEIYLGTCSRQGVSSTQSPLHAQLSQHDLRISTALFFSLALKRKLIRKLTRLLSAPELVLNINYYFIKCNNLNVHLPHTVTSLRRIIACPLICADQYTV